MVTHCYCYDFFPNFLIYWKSSTSFSIFLTCISKTVSEIWCILNYSFTEEKLIYLYLKYFFADSSTWNRIFSWWETEDLKKYFDTFFFNSSFKSIICVRCKYFVIVLVKSFKCGIQIDYFARLFPKVTTLHIS